VLSLDCDYVLCPGFEDELARLYEATPSDAFYASFRYLIFGKPLRACLYPPRAVLFRRDRCRYVPDITGKMRIRWASRSNRILYIASVVERNSMEEHELTCDEKAT
jgi:hypothetical protein